MLRSDPGPAFSGSQGTKGTAQGLAETAGLSAPTLPVACGSSCDRAPAASDAIPTEQTSHLPQNQRLWSSGYLEDRRPLPEQGQRAVLLPTHSGSQEHCTNTGHDRQRPRQRIFSGPNNTATPPPGTKPHRPPIVWAEKLKFAGQTHSAVFEKSVALGNRQRAYRRAGGRGSVGLPWSALL